MHRFEHFLLDKCEKKRYNKQRLLKFAIDWGPMMKIKYYIKLLLPLCCFGVIFRALEIMFAVEPESGFFYLESVIPLLFNIYLFFVCAFYLTVLFFAKQEAKSTRMRLTKTTRLDNFIILAAAVFILSANMKTFLTKFFINNEFSTVKDVFSDISLYMMIFSVFATWFLVAFATSPKKAVKSKLLVFFSLSLSLYYVVRLFCQFTDISQILSKSYGTYTIIFIAFLTLASINLSKMLAGTLCRNLFIATGLITAFMAFVHLVEFVFAFIPGNPYNINIDMLTYLADIFVSMFILRLVIKLTKRNAKEPVPANAPELPEAEEEQTAPENVETVSVSEPAAAAESAFSESRENQQ